MTGPPAAPDEGGGPSPVPGWPHQLPPQGGRAPSPAPAPGYGGPSLPGGYPPSGYGAGGYPAYPISPYSPDGRFFWNGYQWVPLGVATGGGDSSGRVALIIAGVVGVVVIVLVVVFVVIGRQAGIEVFSNFSNAFDTPPPR